MVEEKIDLIGNRSPQTKKIAPFGQQYINYGTFKHTLFFSTRFLQDVFPDKATERKILSFAIRCSSDGCEWTGELRSKEVNASIRMDQHLGS